jgi:hypothetical protein
MVLVFMLCWGIRELNAMVFGQPKWEAKQYKKRE